MKRRDFLSITLPATGAVMIAPGLLNKQAFAEINRQFSGPTDFDQYDVVINGAGLAGYFAAIRASKLGKKVLVVERRTSPGYELASKGRPWLGADGLAELRTDLVQLLLPDGEKAESALKSHSGSGPIVFGDEVPLFSGSIRKGLLRNLLVAKVHVLLMTDVCGVFTDGANVQGVLLASKHGLHAVKCRSLIDASDNVLFSRGLIGERYAIDRAGFVLEMRKVSGPEAKDVSVSKEYGLRDNKLKFHGGKLSDNQLFIEFEFPASSQDVDEIEHRARLISAKLGKDLPRIDASLEKAEIYQFPVETSLHLKDDTLPATKLKGHYLLATPRNLTCRTVMQLESEANSLVEKLQYADTRSKSKSLLTIGAVIPVNKLAYSAVAEPGLSIPMQEVRFDFKGLIGKHRQCQVLVAGGGTAGALAAVGAAEKGADTIVVDYFNDLGGTKTMGGVMGYYHGLTNNKFFKKQNEDAERTAFEANMSTKTGRKLYHLQSLLDAGGKFASGILCNTLVSGQVVKGIVICRDGRLEALESNVTIDATGDGDIAAFAGAEYAIGDPRTGQTQDYSQWDIGGAVAIAGSPTNRDYDMIDNTKISELQRGFFISHYEAHFYDFHPMLTVRESRRIAGVYELDLLDAAEGTHFKDVVSLASSDFDPHNVGSSEYSKAGFLLPHSNDLVVEIPYRCIVPRTLDGLLISGRGFSQTHNALQFTRMSADLLVLGYMTGQIAADLSFKNIRPRDYDVSGLQKEWAQLEYLPADYTRPDTWRQRDNQEEVYRRVNMLAEGHREYLYECSRLSKEKALPALMNECNQIESGDGKLLVGKALAWFGNPMANDLIEDELKDMFRQELAEGYPGGYIDDYDFIRGREKNVLEGLFWRINQNIALLAMSQQPSANATIRHILENTVSGGGMVPRTNDYYNSRIDLKIIPFYNRILNLCFYAERLPDQSFIPGFEKLLQDKNIGGFVTSDYTEVRWKVFGGFLELSIAAAMARCGSKVGLQLLSDYLGDAHHRFKVFAASELRDITGKDFGYDGTAWRKHLAKLSYPRPVKKFLKEVEV